MTDRIDRILSEVGAALNYIVDSIVNAVDQVIDVATSPLHTNARRRAA